MDTNEPNFALIDELALEASDMPISERGAFLNLRCNGDEKLAQQVRNLLLAMDQGSVVLDGLRKEIGSVMKSAEPADELVKDATIGRYTLVREIGRGGMGVVWLAHQAKPIQRHVAIKIMHASQVSRDLLLRFEAEQQALAIMDHQNVARVYDSGTYQNFRPYFVMEYIEGTEITDYCDVHRLTITERLGIFDKIIAGVRHAHQKGLIHRDLKPSNVLVAREEGEAVPKIIDFGIAKAMSDALSGSTHETRIGTLIGTPDYMAPEQTGLMRKGVDTRTDVYALGVMLYQLLVGVLPISSRDDSLPTINSMMMAICNQEPLRPSRMAMALANDPAAIAALRAITPARLVKMLRGDLDWIIMKALSKDPEERYESASDLSADLIRYSSNQPVAAGPPSVVYRARKFALRNAAATFFLTALVFGSVIFGVVSVAQSKRVAASAARAEHQAQVATATVDFLVETFEQASPEVSERAEVTAREIMDRQSRAILANSNLTDEIRASITDAMGRAYMSLGVFDEARAMLESSLALRRAIPSIRRADLADSLATIGWLGYEMGEYEVAERQMGEALALYEQAGEDFVVPKAKLLNNLGILYRSMGSYAKAEQNYLQALAIQETEIGMDSIEVADIRSNLGSLYAVLERLDEARENLTISLTSLEQIYGPDSVNLTETMNALALVKNNLGDRAGAEQLYLSVLDIREEVLGPTHRRTALSLNNLGIVKLERMVASEAVLLLMRAVEVGAAAYGEDHLNVAIFRTNLADALVADGNAAAAELEIQNALTVLSEKRNVPAWRIAIARSVQGLSLGLQGNCQVARDLLSSSLDEIVAAKGTLSRRAIKARNRLDQVQADPVCQQQ